MRAPGRLKLEYANPSRRAAPTLNSGVATKASPVGPIFCSAPVRAAVRTSPSPDSSPVPLLAMIVGGLPVLTRATVLKPLGVDVSSFVLCANAAGDSLVAAAEAA